MVDPAAMYGIPTSTPTRDQRRWPRFTNRAPSPPLSQITPPRIPSVTGIGSRRPSPAVTPRLSPSLVHSTPSRTPGRTPASVGRVSGQAENEDADSATGTRTVDGKLQHLQEAVDKLLEMHEMSAANSSSSSSSNTARHQKLPKELTVRLNYNI